MKYILCEDSGSGYSFFRYMVQSLCSSKYECEVITTNGNSGYEECLENLIEKLESKDTLILAFDSVEVTEHFNPRNIINSAKYFCKQKNVSLYYTIYYCFEELFLSYRYLEEMFDKSSYNAEDKEVWLRILQYICECIHKNEEYYVSQNELVDYVKENIKKARKTKEKFTKVVLTHVSGSIIGDFKVYDGKLGKCWAISCNDVKIKNKCYRCTQCNSRFKNKLGKEKIRELELNAIPILSVPCSKVLSDNNQ